MTGGGFGPGGSAGRAGGADLHVHSCASDGTDPPRRVVERAAEAGLAAIALTDHDTAEGLEEAAQRGEELGVEVIPGIEISAEHEGKEVHLLGYFFSPDNRQLSERLAALRAERARRIERIVARLNESGIPITVEEVRSGAKGGSIGRPHVADALVHGGYVSSDKVAWDEYLRSGGRAYVPRARLAVAEAVDLLRRAGGVLSVAHPTLNLDLHAIEEIAASGVVALETTHPRIGEADAAALSRICRRVGLIETGGSDCHGSRRGGPVMGQYRVPIAIVEKLRRSAAGRLLPRLEDGPAAQGTPSEPPLARGERGGPAQLPVSFHPGLRPGQWIKDMLETA